ncbi:hypothetical protein [Jeotgalibacillus sp. R-1-5s-1]|uniref:hypothetical protein n=1 Tax=Jeotgalibacillus sp. R-1-5s-1 TaxID=2555897 RepID=UPI001069BAF7|nr:hypothetical protein [Jeotgalibacillus sp. R-1-5s-1]TFD99930.1 hypothetical protein E2491_05650 [Jeotgalibacillus sp. R-1-5s-1]
MTTYTVLLIFYPAAFFMMGIFLGLILKSKMWSLPAGLFIGYVLSNVGFFFLTEGGFPGIEQWDDGNGFSVFQGIEFYEWLSILSTPNFFTLFYIGLLLWGTLIIQKFTRTIKASGFKNREEVRS